MRLHSLPLPQHDPRPQRDDVAPHDRRADERGDPQDEDLERVRVRGRETHRGRELVVLPMDFPVGPLGVEPPVQPVVAVVLDDKESRELERHFGEGGEGDAAVDASNLESEKKTQILVREPGKRVDPQMSR